MKKSIIYSSILLFFAGIFFVTNDAIINYLSQTDVKFYHFIFYGIPIFLCFPFYFLINGSNINKTTETKFIGTNPYTKKPKVVVIFEYLFAKKLCKARVNAP